MKHILLILLLGLLVFFFMSPLAAQEEIQASADISNECKRIFSRQDKLRDSDSQIQQELAEVFTESAFPSCYLESRWQFKDEENSRDLNDDSNWLSNPFSAGLADIIEFILWLIFAAFIGLLIWWLIKHAGSGRFALTQKKSISETPALILNGQEITPENYSDNSADTAWELWQNGDYRPALSLLYRASLAKLMQHYRVDFGTSATEGECLRTADRQLDKHELIDFLRQLTLAWQSVAYAHRLPEEIQVKRLCSQWPEHFVVNKTNEQ